MSDPEIKRLMKNLGDAISETLGDSPRINETIQSIRDAGYEVFLVIEAKIGFNRKNRPEGEAEAEVRATDEPVRLKITSEDAKFLKSLKISVDPES